MTATTRISDEQLLELLRGADPLANIGASPAVESDAVGIEGERLLRRILASEHSRTSRPSWRRIRQRPLVVGAAFGSGVAAAVAAVLVFTAGNAPSVAFAGWSADPTAPADGQVQSAEAECQRNPTLASLKPAVADTRGPYTLLMYAAHSGEMCVTGPASASPLRSAHVFDIGAFLAASAANGHPAPSPTPIAANAIQNRIRGVSTITTATASAPEVALRFDVGQTGANVTAVTLVLQDGSRVETTTANGWFAAWWPDNVEAQTAEITTTTGANTQALIPPQSKTSARDHK